MTGTRLIRRSLEVTSAFFAGVAVVAMILLLATGLFLIFKSLAEFAVPGVGHTPDAATLLVRIIKGLEFVFLAPLPLFIVLAATQRAIAWLSGEPVEDGGEQLEIIKKYIAGLFISVTAAQLLLQIVAGELTSPGAAVPGLGLIVGLTFYVAVLSRKSADAAPRKNEETSTG